MFDSVEVICPYCGESFDTTMDTLAEDSEYTEDCPVCCQPILFIVRYDVHTGRTEFHVRRENE